MQKCLCIPDRFLHKYYVTLYGSRVTLVEKLKIPSSLQNITAEEPQRKCVFWFWGKCNPFKSSLKDFKKTPPNTKTSQKKNQPKIPDITIFLIILVDSALLSFLAFQTKVTYFIYLGVVVETGNAFFQQENQCSPSSFSHPQPKEDFRPIQVKYFWFTHWSEKAFGEI